MKKVLLIFVLLITTNLSAKTLSDFIEDDNIRKGYYDGDPNRNEIIEANDDYIIIRNLTALSNIEINVGKPFNVNYQTSSEVFYIEALKHCEKNTKFNIQSHYLNFSEIFFLYQDKFRRQKRNYMVHKL